MRGGALHGDGHEGMEVAVLHYFQTHTLDMIHIFFMFRDKPDTEEVPNIDRHRAQALAAPETGEVILENITSAVVALTAMTYPND